MSSFDPKEFLEEIFNEHCFLLHEYANRPIPPSETIPEWEIIWGKIGKYSNEYYPPELYNIKIVTNLGTKVEIIKIPNGR